MGAVYRDLVLEITALCRRLPHVLFSGAPGACVHFSVKQKCEALIISRSFDFSHPLRPPLFISRWVWVFFVHSYTQVKGDVKRHSLFTAWWMLVSNYFFIDISIINLCIQVRSVSVKRIFCLLINSLIFINKLWRKNMKPLVWFQHICTPFSLSCLSGLRNNFQVRWLCKRRKPFLHMHSIHSYIV